MNPSIRHRLRKKRRLALQRWRRAQREEPDYGGCVNCGVPLWCETAYVSESGDGYFCWRCVRDENMADQRGDDDSCFDDPWFDEDDGEPLGSCENCGSDLYADDDLDNELCDQCSWWAQQ